MRNFIGYLALLIVAVQIFLADPPAPPPIPPPDIVVPPGPGPGPGPQPPTPITQGERTVVILYETEQSTVDLTNMIYQLRNGANAEYFISKSHTLYVLDDDTANAEGELSEFVAALLPINSVLPVLHILDSRDGRPLHNETLPLTATADDVMRILKANGG